jgi:hypothetical protein
MRKPTDKDSYKLDVAWIPAKFAKVGKYVKIKQEDGSWDNGWEITSVGSKRKAEYVESNERDYLKQRKASDV